MIYLRLYTDQFMCNCACVCLLVCEKDMKDLLVTLFSSWWV